MPAKKIDRRRIKWTEERRARHSQILKAYHAQRKAEVRPTFWQTVKKAVFG